MIKIFIPVILLALFQLCGFFLYTGFNLQVKIDTQLIIFGYYLIFIFTLISCSFIFEKNEKISKYECNFLIKIMFLIFSTFLILIPAIKIFIMGQVIGYDVMRVEFYSNPAIINKAFGSGMIFSISNYYLIPCLWFFLFFLTGDTGKWSAFTFYFILIVLILYNTSYGGRFNVYFSLIVLYLRNIMMGNGLYLFLKKNILLLFVLLSSSFIVFFNRNTEGASSNEHGLMSLLEYHLLPPYILAEKMDSNLIIMGNPEMFPFKDFYYVFFAPFKYILGLPVTDIPSFRYQILFNDFTLTSNVTGLYYNAYSTLFPYFYEQYGLLSFFMIFVYFFIFFSLSFLIGNHDVRVKYLAFFSFSLYISLFQSLIFSPGFLSVLIFVPLYYCFKDRLGRSKF